MKDKIVIIGMPGSGKTTIGKMIADKSDLNFFDMDEYIEKFTGKTIAQLFENGEDYFRDIETEACRKLSKINKALISTGGGVVKKRENIEIFKEQDSFIIFLDRPLEKILSDVDVSKRPLLKDGKEKVIKLYQERYELYREAADAVVLNDGGIEEAEEKIINIIGMK